MASNDTVLVAPRPLRITPFSTVHRHSPRILSPQSSATTTTAATDDKAVPDPGDSTTPSGRDSASPRTSPRLSLSADALEEFLSILRPTFFTPSTSSPFRPRRHGSGSVPPSSFPQLDADDSEYTRKKTETPSPALIEGGDQFNSNARSWRIPGILESPISRTNTRNPFQRHPSYEVAISSVITSHLSPALLPLPPSPPASAQPSDALENDELNA